MYREQGQVLAPIFISGMAEEEERTVVEGNVPQEAKEEMMSVKDMWSGCHRAGNDSEEGQIKVLWGLSLYNLENRLSKRIQN